MGKHVPPLPLNETERLAALHDLRILDTAPEAHFDAVCSTAAALFSVPMTLVSLIDIDRQWFKAKCGITVDGTPRDLAFCAYAILNDDALVVEDATTDPRFANNPLVTGEPGIRFYAGAPLVLRSGIRLGTLCIIDTKPRSFSEAQRTQLEDLAEIVVAHIELHRKQLAVQAALEERTRAQEDILKARKALEETTDLLRLAQEAAGAGIWHWSLGEDVVRNSPESARMLGFSVEPGSADWIDISKAEWAEWVHPDDLAMVRAAHVAALRDDTVYKVEYRVRLPEGSDGYRWLMSFGRIIRDAETGRPTRIVGLDLDVTERHTTQESLIKSEARLALALDSGSDGLWDWDITTGHVWYSDRWQTMLGYMPGEIEPHIRSWTDLTHPDDLQQAQSLLKDHFEGRSDSYVCEHRVRTKAGAYSWILARGRVVAWNEQRAPLRIVGTYIDITERKAVEERIAHIACHDALTGLPNRTVFREQLKRRLAEVRRGRGQAALLCLDLDRFKTVNDTLGHPAGDDLLCQIAARLRATVRDSDVVVRLGGDEFAIIVPHLDHPHQASKLAERLIDAVGQPLDLGGHLVTVGTSIGIALAPGNGGTPETLFKNADIALYRAKAAARNNYCFYEAGMDAAVETRMRLELEMREAVMCDGFALHYQPVLRLSEDRIIGFEALMRWPHPTRGMIAPDEFIPLAEESGLIVPLGSWALHEACSEAASWPGELTVAVNVSTVQFQRPGLEQSVLSALEASGLAPHRLILEITESVLVQDAEAVIACLHRLRNLGVRIALDDFGTGYSSLSYLRRFPFDKIKIDRTFIREISDPGAAAIVRAVVGIATQLGATVTAEGVETTEQFEQVRQKGCTDVQGYLVSRPLTAEKAAEFIGSSTSTEQAYERLCGAERQDQHCACAA
ncbi:sensor domain-containing phosphodiesterase [Methylorubrum extorquens]|uniref:EAL domain-containing protein n=1 Tax=Methylorubrum extorquens TaxID=408 RepID=A0AAX3WHQ3_METEX|nr:EAL domain-containing protein [Methylorubrum extorquens]WHQ70090.1 EAL domain-containing protein [Methylorubrum extorquens]